MTRLNKDHIRNMMDLLDSGTPEVVINEFTVKNSGSRQRPYVSIEYKGEDILRREFNDISVRRILDILYLPSTYNKLEKSIPKETDWSYVKESEHLREWQTNIDENSVYVKVKGQRAQNNYTVHAPVEDKSQWKTSYGSTNPDVAGEGKSFETLDSALMYVTTYLTSYSPAEVDKYVRMDEVAREEFQDISGVGEKTVEDLVDDKHVRTYEGLKENIREISRNYRDDAKEQIEQKLEEEELVQKDPYVQTITAKIVSEAI